MDTANRSSKAAEILQTFLVIAICTAAFIAWRTVIGQDDGVLILLSRLF